MHASRGLGLVAVVLVALFAPAVGSPAAGPGAVQVRVESLDLDVEAPAPVLEPDAHPETHPEEDPGADAEPDRAPEVVDREWWTTTDVPAGDGVMVGADWGGTDTDVAVRARQDGTWTEWLPLEVSADQPDGPEAAQANPDTSAPVWFGHVEAFQVRASDPVDLDLHVVDEVEAPATPSSSAEAATVIRPRSAWGADESLRGGGDPSIASELKFGVVHHEGGTPRWTSSEIANGCVDAAAAIRAIYAYHTQSHGWWDIGYNFVVDPCGTIWEGRHGGVDRNVVGAHAAGFNTGSFGVLALGTFHGSSSDPITTAMVRSIEDVFAYRFSLAGIDATTTVQHTGGCNGCSSRYPAGTTVTLPRVSAHQVTSTTSCPGEDLMAYLFDGWGANGSPASWFTRNIKNKTTATPPSTDPVLVGRWHGTTRVETAVDVSARAFPSADVAVLATTRTYPDGLVAGPLAASRQAPVLLTTPNGLPEVVQTELQRLGVSSVDLVGGEAVIHSTVVRDLRAMGITRIRRLSGADRFETARRVANDVRGRTGGRAALVALGRHDDDVTAYADALTAAAYGSLTVAPVLLTAPTGLPEASARGLAGTSTLAPVNRVVLVGGSYALPSGTADQVEDAVPNAVNLSAFAGRNRYETSVLALGSLVERDVVSGAKVMMASGGNWPDALAAGAAAARLRRPLVLVPPRSGFDGSVVDAATTSWGMTHANVIGGSAAVSDTVVAEIRGW